MAASMHLVLSLLHFTSFFSADKSIYMNIEALKMISILIQVLNFISAMTLFARAPPYMSLTNDEQILKLWLMIESVYVFSLFVTTIIYILIRSIERPKLVMTLGDSKDKKNDFLSDEQPQLLITLFIQPLWPIITHEFLEVYFDGAVDTRSHSMLSVQIGLQWVQLVCFLYVLILVPVKPDETWLIDPRGNFGWFFRFLRYWNRYIAYSLTLVYLLVVPVVSIIHWGYNYKTNIDETNSLGPWCSVYPLVGVMTIIYYIWQISGTIDSVRISDSLGENFDMNM